GARGGVTGGRRLERLGIAEHREVFLHRRFGHVALPELPSQPAATVLQEPARGGRIVEGLVVARAILLVVHVLAEGASKGGGMRARKHGERGEALGGMESGDARDLPAPGVPPEMERA